MFESKINRGRANGYAPLDSGSKVPLSYLPPIQSTIDTGSLVTIGQTGSFATTGSNVFYGDQTINGIISASVKIDVPNINLKGGNVSFNQNGAGLLHTGQLNITTNFENTSSSKTWAFNQYGNLTTPGDINVSGSVNISGSLNISSSLVVSSTIVNNANVNLSGSNLIIDDGDIILSGSLNVIPSSTLSIGDSFGGGKIAYILTSSDAGYDENYIIGIIAAEADEVSTLNFGAAITACDNKTTNGYSDWYLPSKDELNQLYLNRVAIGGFSNGAGYLSAYWSSTMAVYIGAWAQYFSDGTQIDYEFVNTSNVRAIRSFSIAKPTLHVNNSGTTISGYLILTGSEVPTSLSGSEGDKQGMVVFDNDFLYYCTYDYLPNVNNVRGQGNGSNITIPIVAGVPLNIQSTGWAITVPTDGGDVTYNITGAYYETTYWYLEIDGGYGAAAGTAMTLTNSNPLPDIWKKISLDGIVSIDSGSFATTGSNIFIGSQTIQGTNPSTPEYVTKFVGSGSGAKFAIGVSQDPTFGIANDVLNAAENGYAPYTLTAESITLNGNVTISDSINVTGSIITDSITGSLLSTNGVISSSNQIAGYGYATTGSNTFKATQTISGSIIITENLTILGSSSIQYISQSNLNIETNIISVNTTNPGARFGGIAVIDSGSNPKTSGSLLFDSVDDEWIFVHQPVSGEAVTSSTVITGPQTTNNLGNETHLTDNRIPKTKDGFHIYDSNISDDGTTIKLNSNTEITGSLFVSGAFYISSVATISSSFSLPSGSSLILTSGSNIYVDSSGSITGSLSGSVFGIGNVVAFSSSVNSRFSGVYSSSAQLPSGLVSASSQVLNGSGVYSSSAQLPSGLVSSSAQISALGFGAGGATGSSNAPILAVATLSSSYSASLNDCVLLLSASNMIVTLPTAVGNTGKVYYVKNLLAVGTQTIKTAGGRIETIAANTGDVTATIGGSGANLIIVSNGVDWWELGTH